MPYPNFIYNIVQICERDCKYRSQMDPYHCEVYTKFILNNKLLLPVVTEPTK